MHTVFQTTDSNHFVPREFGNPGMVIGSENNFMPNILWNIIVNHVLQKYTQKSTKQIKVSLPVFRSLADCCRTDNAPLLLCKIHLKWPFCLNICTD